MRSSVLAPLPLLLTLASTLACRDTPPPVTPSDPQPQAQPEPAPPSVIGYWQGLIVLPGGERTLEWALSIQPSPDDPEAPPISTLWIPAQGVAGVTIGSPTPVEVLSGAFEVAWPELGASWILYPEQIPPCSFTQAGMTLECDLEAIDAEEFAALTTPKRPQTPQPPFPYAIEEVRFDNPDAPGVSLAGTLTIPEGPGPHPAVVLLTGSGLQDRDEALFGHKPFWVLADHLSRNGVAVLRYDDRGAGESKGDAANATMVDFASDGWAAVRYLAGRPEIAKDEIGVLGHSEGGVTGPMIAAAHPKQVAFVIMMAGTGVDGSAVVLHQTRLLMAAAGVDPKIIEAEIANSEALHRILRETPADQREAALEQELRRQLESATAEADADAAKADVDLDAVVAKQMQVLDSPWFRHFVAWDPAPTLGKLKVPVLVLAGDRDLQVDPTQNLPPIEAALKKNRKAEIRRFPGLNHLFQPAQTGGMDEYGLIETTIDPAVLTAISEWLRATTGLK